MDFELSEEQELLRNGLRDLLDRACDARRVRALAYENGYARDGDLWSALADAGWTGIAVPEADGGAGRRFEDLALVFEEAGRCVLPLPLTTTLLASRILAATPDSASRSAILGRITRGEAGVTLALRGSPDDYNGERTGCTAERAGDGWRLSGSHAFVPFGAAATLVLVEAVLPSGVRGLFVVPADAPGSAWIDLNALDRTVPQFELALDGVVLPSEASVFGEADAGDSIGRLLDEWRVALAAETLGAGGKLLEMSVAYAKDRVQFDRPIGTNQAVKARIADMGAAVERMRAAVYHAAVKIDSDAPDRPLAVAMAKVATAAPGAFVGSQAIHVHGGIGFTWEHDTHLYFKRIKSNELLLGDGAASLARVADAVL
jgi:acyl-CoA dehydrogenase